ncbi:MAG TPA: DUF3347 domain-containing protein [Flavobacterium sp.]|jgi:copper chaperone CopZ|uniref:DUF3347 domain-containing protein n=1 Tax=Flavobacterium sp. TaxID=239 RepID=UPI002CF75659|nr:DUF3347 domain-containing protein [Flavobacterium sp.]HPW97091.1 DUF3347 domain-containing protein [Flavobacterium sp.]HQA73474.1 DUF3347 domain-containing protein [Flavobacterium sp.]
MKNSLKYLMIAFVMVSFISCNAQIKNAKTEQIKIYGNCGMCKKTIEKAGNNKKVSQVDWDKDTKMATITYDAKATNKDEILKRIALAGYDSDSFLAPNDVYENLPGCCQYDRVAKTPIKEEMKSEMKMEANHSDMTLTEMQKANQLDAVYENYFAIKDALVKTDGNAASAKANELLISINTLKMSELKIDVHTVWMKVMNDLKADATLIYNSTDAKKQRASFDTLSENIYQLIKVSKTETPVYYQHCPMANDGKGANWLSKENTIKNPYYGSMMLSCGKVVETIR